jgi:hypothetical protein
MDAPAALGVTVPVLGRGDHSSDESDLTKVRAEARPEAVPRAARVVYPRVVEEVT